MRDETSTVGTHHSVFGERRFIEKVIRNGIKPPEFLYKPLLLKGAVHWILGPTEVAKTWLALLLAVECVKAGKRVLYIDLENGADIVGERIDLLGWEPGNLDRDLVYYDESNLRTDAASLKAYDDYLDEITPALAVFDASRGLLTSLGLEENENDDLETFHQKILRPLRKRGITVVVIDHVPLSDPKRARGATRKMDSADVVWAMKRNKPFDQTSVGEIQLDRMKARRGGLPKTVRFSIGTGENGFMLRRSDGTIETPEPTDDLTATQRKIYEHVRDAGEAGATRKEIHRATGVSTGSISNAFNGPLLNLVLNRDGRNFAVERLNPEDGLLKPDGESSTEFNQGSIEPDEPRTNGTVQQVHSLKESEPVEPSAEPNSEQGSRSEGRVVERKADHPSPSLAPTSEQVSPESGEVADVASLEEVFARSDEPHPLDCPCQECSTKTRTYATAWSPHQVGAPGNGAFFFASDLTTYTNARKEG
jgi:KaiC/GvpD/RAD55 family RecA-like ATPase